MLTPSTTWTISPQSLESRAIVYVFGEGSLQTFSDAVTPGLGQHERCPPHVV